MLRTAFKRAVAILRPDVALVMAVLIFRACTEIFFGGVLEEYDGMGGDGRQHVVIANELAKVIAERETTAYHYRHMLPYVTVHAAMTVLGLPHDVDRPRGIIVAHQIQNTLFLLIACFAWGRTLERLAVGTMVRWLSFALLFLNFGLVKMPYYHACNGDSAQFLTGVLMLHAFVTRRYWWLIVVATLGFYVRSGVDIYALALLAFRQPRPDDPPPRPTPWVGEFAAGAGAIVIGLIATWYFSPYFWVRVIQPPFGFLRVFSVVIVTAFTYFALHHLLKAFPLATLRRINVVPLVSFLVINFALRALTNAVARPPSLLETSELRMLFSSVALGVGRPGIAIISHVVFFGPVIALLYVLWPRVCAVAREFGPSMVAALGVVVLLGLNSETRVLNTAFPIVALLIAIVLDRLTLSTAFAWGTAAIALAWSRVWLSMGGDVPWSRAAYPDLLYWIHQGPWMPTAAYIVQSAIVIPMIAWFAWCFHAAELRRAWQGVGNAVRSGESLSTRWSALRGRFSAWLDRIGRPAAKSIAIGWAVVLLIGLIAVPLGFSRLPENSAQLVIEPEPNIVAHGVAMLRLKDATGGMPYLDGVMDIEWKYGFPPEGGRLYFGDSSAAATAAYFNHLGDYYVLAKARFKAIPREFVLLDRIRVRGLGPAQPLDFGYDGADDLAWYLPNSGQFSIDVLGPDWRSNSVDVIAEPFTRWRPIFIADFTADRHSDVLWRDTEGGGVAIHELSAGEFVSSRALSGPPPGWVLATAAYIDADGLADLVYVYPPTNEVAAHQLRARAVPVIQPLNRPRNPADKLLAIADLTEDGRADLLWRNAATGAIEMTVNEPDAVGFDQPLAAAPDPDFALVECADYDQDGRNDLVWHDATGGRWIRQSTPMSESSSAAVDAITPGLMYLGGGLLVDPNDPNSVKTAIYWLNPAQHSVHRSLANPKLREFSSPVQLGALPDDGLVFVRVGDYDGDGSGDLLFRNPITGAATIGFGRRTTLEFRWPLPHQRSAAHELVLPAPIRIVAERGR